MLWLWTFVKKNSPIKTIIIPIMFSIFGFDLIIRIWTKGRIAMFVPVIKAEFDAVVYLRPAVWVRNPKNKKSPRNNPYLISSNLNFIIFLKKIIENIRVVRKNLIRTKVKGEEYNKPNLISGKLKPQVNETNNKIDSALYCNILLEWILVSFIRRIYVYK